MLMLAGVGAGCVGVAAANVATIETLDAGMAKLQARFVPLHSIPLQPLNVAVPAGLAAIITAVPAAYDPDCGDTEPAPFTETES